MSKDLAVNSYYSSEIFAEYNIYIAIGNGTGLQQREQCDASLSAEWLRVILLLKTITKNIFKIINMSSSFVEIFIDTTLNFTDEAAGEEIFPSLLRKGF